MRTPHTYFYATDLMTEHWQQMSFLGIKRLVFRKNIANSVLFSTVATL